MSVAGTVLRTATAAAGLCGGLVLAGCHRAAAPTGFPAAAKQYSVRGKVIATDPSTSEVVLDSEAIPGFMDAMIMPYKLKDASVLKELHPGDRIAAVLLVNDVDDRLDQIVVISQGLPDYKPQSTYNELKAGDAVPDFKLINQSGRQIHLGQFRGKVLLVTFIYTRCPLPDYCPRMSRNFAQLDKALSADPGLYAKTHLLTISFDPGYDTPAVLRSYGGAYTGKYTTENFAHWDFASPRKGTLPELLNFFVVGVTPGEGTTLTHSLSTVVIGPDGKVYKWYPTNDWTPADLMADVKEIAGRTS